jgi:hypothetical protein
MVVSNPPWFLRRTVVLADVQIDPVTIQLVRPCLYARVAVSRGLMSLARARARPSFPPIYLGSPGCSSRRSGNSGRGVNSQPHDSDHCGGSRCASVERRSERCATLPDRPELRGAVPPPARVGSGEAVGEGEEDRMARGPTWQWFATRGKDGVGLTGDPHMAVRVKARGWVKRAVVIERLARAS